MKLIYYTDEHFDRWEDYIKRSERSSLYHRIGWKGVVEKSLGHKTCYLLAEDEGRIVGVLPLVLISRPFFGRCVVSMPFLNYGGICADSDEAEHLLVEEAVEITRRENADYLELRQMERTPHDLVTSEDKVAMLIDLESDPEVLWSRFNPKLRQTIRKAEKSGLQITVGSEENIERFYDVFSANMRELGSPVYHKDFFRAVLSEFPNEMLIFAVTYRGKTIGAAFVGLFKKRVEGFWASSLREYFDLSPNEYLYWKQLEYACGHGYSRFDLGRSTKDSGSFKFKRKFGAQPKQLYWQYYLNNVGEIPQMNPKSVKYRVAIGLWRRFPLRVTKLVGPQIRKYLPQ